MAPWRKSEEMAHLSAGAYVYINEALLRKAPPPTSINGLQPPSPGGSHFSSMTTPFMTSEIQTPTLLVAINFE